MQRNSEADSVILISEDDEMNDFQEADTVIIISDDDGEVNDLQEAESSNVGFYIIPNDDDTLVREDVHDHGHDAPNSVWVCNTASQTEEQEDFINLNITDNEIDEFIAFLGLTRDEFLNLEPTNVIFLLIFLIDLIIKR